MRCRIDVVATFGDREGDDTDRGVRELCDDGLAIAHWQEVYHRGGDPRWGDLLDLLNDSGQVVLGREPAAQICIAFANAGAKDRPFPIEAKVEEVIEIDSLVCALEIPHAEVHDPRGQLFGSYPGPEIEAGSVPRAPRLSRRPFVATC